MEDIAEDVSLSTIRTNEVIELSRQLITHLYHHDFDWCLSRCWSKIVFMGTTTPEFAMGKDEFKALLDDLLSRLYLGAVSQLELWAQPSPSIEAWVISARFVLVSDPTSGHIVATQKRASLLWHMLHGQPTLMHIHISTPRTVTDASGVMPDSERDTYRYAKALLDQVIRRDNVELRDTSGKTHYFSPVEVVYLEAQRQRTVVHGMGGSIVVRRGIKDLLGDFGGTLVPVHRSFAVNPQYVRATSPDEVTLEDGTRIPLPQRRSAAVRRELDQAIEQLNASKALREAPPRNISYENAQLDQL